MTDNDRADQRIRLDRRTALTAIGGIGLTAAGVGALGAAAHADGTPRSGPAAGPTAAPVCVLAPELTEGPYYLDYELVRHDITEGRPGVPLILRATVVNATSCAPLPRAAVDIWHCDAIGEYSGYTALGPGGGSGGPMPTATPTDTPTGPPPGGGHVDPTDDLTFLRGVALTDRLGVAEFRTIYPGWYNGRAIHIHAKVHIGGETTAAHEYSGGHVAHTGQFFFDETTTTQIAQLEPYATDPATRVTLDEDSIYQNGGSAGLLTLRPLYRGRPITAGVLATIVVGVDPVATPDPV